VLLLLLAAAASRDVVDDVRDDCDEGAVCVCCFSAGHDSRSFVDECEGQKVDSRSVRVLLVISVMASSQRTN